MNYTEWKEQMTNSTEVPQSCCISESGCTGSPADVANNKTYTEVGRILQFMFVLDMIITQSLVFYRCLSLPMSLWICHELFQNIYKAELENILIVTKVQYGMIF